MISLELFRTILIKSAIYGLPEFIKSMDLCSPIYECIKLLFLIYSSNKKKNAIKDLAQVQAEVFAPSESTEDLIITDIHKQRDYRQQLLKLSTSQLTPENQALATAHCNIERSIFYTERH